MLVEWQPIAGCSYASPGCTYCKTMHLVGSDLRQEFERDGLVKESRTGPVWTGDLRFSEARLNEPSARQEPATVFVNPHGDLFHENAPDAWIDRVFEVMESADWHTYQVLTKRAARMSRYINARYAEDEPPSNLHVGVSCERQEEAEERLPLLQETRAAMRYVTLYPLLGPINLAGLLTGVAVVMAGEEPERPTDPAWVQALETQCLAVDVPFIFESRLIGQIAA